MSLDRFINLVAAHNCIVCRQEGSLICNSCRPHILVAKRSTCFLCNKLTQNWRTCASCRHATKLGGVIVASHYENHVKKLVGLLKYHRAQNAASVLAKVLAPMINAADFDYVIAVPGATKRLRQRGYNPAYLIAKNLAMELGLPYLNNLRRLGQKRQVGTDRRRRIEQIKNQIYLVRPQIIKNNRILLVDDVVTTGATISECGRILKVAGAKSVWGAAVAKH